MNAIEHKPDRVVTLFSREVYLAPGHKFRADTEVRVQQFGSHSRI